MERDSPVLPYSLYYEIGNELAVQGHTRFCHHSAKKLCPTPMLVYFHATYQ